MFLQRKGPENVGNFYDNLWDRAVKFNQNLTDRNCGTVISNVAVN